MAKFEGNEKHGEVVAQYIADLQAAHCQVLAAPRMFKTAASDALRAFLSAIEIEQAAISAGHSPLYWMNCIRRPLDSAFTSAGPWQLAVRNVRDICEIAAIKHGDYESRDWHERQGTGIQTGANTSDITYEYSPEDNLQLLKLIGLSALYYGVGRLFRRVGKGAFLERVDGQLTATFESEAAERLVRLHDARAVRWATLFGNLGMLGGRGVREVGVTDDVVDHGDLRAVGDLKCLPAVVRVDPITVPRERLQLSIAGEEYRLAQINYLRTILHVPGLVTAFALTDTMRERFVEANDGLTPEEVFFCTWVADAVQTALVRAEPGVWLQLHTAGFCTYSTKALLTMWSRMARDRSFMGWFPRSIVLAVRRDKEDLMNRFYSNFAFTHGMRGSLSSDATTKYFILELSQDFVLVDFTRLDALLIEATRFALEEKQAELKRTKLFEAELAKFLENEAGVQRFAFPVGAKFEDDRGTFVEVDVSPIIGNCLLWIECKTAKWSVSEMRGEHRAVRNRWDVVAAGDKSWLKQAERGAKEIARRRVWKNGGLPHDVKWILPVVCSSKVEYIAAAEEQYFLTQEIPRICTPGELAKFIGEWDWEWVKKRPYLIQVGE